MAGAFFDFWPQFDVASFRQLCHLDGRLLADHCVVVPDGSNHSPSPARPCLLAASGRLCAPICRYPQHLDVHPSSGSAPVLSASFGWKVPDTVLVGDASSGVRPYHTRIRCFPPAFHRESIQIVNFFGCNFAFRIKNKAALSGGFALCFRCLLQVEERLHARMLRHVAQLLLDAEQLVCT